MKIFMMNEKRYLGFWEENPLFLRCTYVIRKSSVFKVRLSYWCTKH